MTMTKSSSTNVIVEEESEDVNVPPSRAFHTKNLLSDCNQEEIRLNHDENSSYCMPIDHDSPLRKGTLMSATINLLTSMVGGGSLSLPFAFAKAGNSLLGPILLLVCASSASYTLRILMDASARVSHNQPPRTGNTSYEIVCQNALGGQFQYSTMCMIISVCFVGTLGYAVLIRDLCVPLAHWIHPPSSSTSEQPTPLENILMFAIVAAVTPLCTFSTLTSLQNFGILSILSVSILGSCIVYRSVQCIAASSSTTNDLVSTPPYIHPNGNTVPLFSFLPTSFPDFLQAFPLVLNCFFCQFNAIPVHAELANPTPRRVSYISKAVVIFASFFYVSIGIFGSIFGTKCTPTGIVSGNILLDFDDDDPVVTLGRVCLGITIAFAFPCQVIPARDTLLRLIRVIQVKKRSKNAAERNNNDVTSLDDRNDLLLEPLLDGDSLDQYSLTSTSNDMNNYNTAVYPSNQLRIGVAIAIFWSAAAIASRVSSVAVIWDLLGSSLVVLVGFLIPCAICIRILCDEDNWNWRKISAMAMIGLYLPLMILCTGNAIRINIVSS